MVWVIKTKEDERKKKKGGVMEGCLFFLSSFFVCFLKVFSSGDFGLNLVVFFVF